MIQNIVPLQHRKQSAVPRFFVTNPKKKPRNDRLISCAANKIIINFLIMSKSVAKVNRKFLPNEVPFTDTFIFTESRRFSKIFEMYIPIHSTNDNGTHVLEWTINCSVTELTTTAKMYYQRYNITTK